MSHTEPATVPLPTSEQLAEWRQLADAGATVPQPTSEQLAEWRQLADAATPGPWGVALGEHIVRGLEVTGHNSYTCISSVCTIADVDDREPWLEDEERHVYVDPEHDAAFIAAARDAVPALLAEVDRLRAELADERGRHEQMERQALALLAITERAQDRRASMRAEQDRLRATLDAASVRWTEDGDAQLICDHCEDLICVIDAHDTALVLVDCTTSHMRLHHDDAHEPTPKPEYSVYGPCATDGCKRSATSEWGLCDEHVVTELLDPDQHEAAPSQAVQ